MVLKPPTSQVARLLLVLLSLSLYLPPPLIDVLLAPIHTRGRCRRPWIFPLLSLQSRLRSCTNTTKANAAGDHPAPQRARSDVAVVSNSTTTVTPPSQHHPSPSEGCLFTAASPPRHPAVVIAAAEKTSTYKRHSLLSTRDRERGPILEEEQAHRKIIMDPTPLPPPPGSVARVAPRMGLGQRSTQPSQTSRSCGSVTSQHIKWVSELRSARGRWSSEVQGPWTETENAYFEFAHDLFRAGLLEGIEVGLPLRFFMSELLG